MLASLEMNELEAQAIQKMSALNREIINVPDLNENYQSVLRTFKLNKLNFDELWTDYLKPYCRNIFAESMTKMKL